MENFAKNATIFREKFDSNFGLLNEDPDSGNMRTLYLPLIIYTP